MSGLGLRQIEPTNNLNMAIAVLLFFWKQCKTKTACSNWVRRALTARWKIRRLARTLRTPVSRIAR